MIDMHLTDARAAAIKVAELYGMTISVYQIGNTGRYIVTNTKSPLPSWVFVEKHTGPPIVRSEHGEINPKTQAPE